MFLNTNLSHEFPLNLRIKSKLIDVALQGPACSGPFLPQLWLPLWCLHWHRNKSSVPRISRVIFLLAFAHALPPIGNVLSSSPYLANFCSPLESRLAFSASRKIPELLSLGWVPLFFAPRAPFLPGLDCIGPCPTTLHTPVAGSADVLFTAMPWWLEHCLLHSRLVDNFAKRVY